MGEVPTQMLLEYGVLGLGWVFFGVMFHLYIANNNKTMEKMDKREAMLRDVIRANTEAMALLAERVNQGSK